MYHPEYKCLFLYNRSNYICAANVLPCKYISPSLKPCLINDFSKYSIAIKFSKNSNILEKSDVFFAPDFYFVVI